MLNTKFSRRNFLKSMAATAALPTLSTLSNVSFAASGQADHTVISVFLRGGMDSLSALIPYTEQAYYDARPTISIPEEGRIALDEQFALNKMLSPLEAIYNQGDLAFVVAAGLGTESATRSHFSAQRRMESGSADDMQMDGWMGRYLASKEDTNAIFRGVGMGGVKKTLTGFDSSLGIAKLSSFKINARGINAATVPDTLMALYGKTDHPVLSGQSTRTLEAIEVAASKQLGTTEKPEGYGTSKLGDGLHQVAELINSGVGLEAATVEMGGWDFHREMGAWDTGDQALKFSELANALAAFYEEIYANRSNVTVVVMSEFGRRVKENTSNGADHGKGTAMMVMGSGIAGGQVYGNWPSLDADNLDRGDLKVTTDYRQVLAELVDYRMGRPDLLEATLPDYKPETYLGIFG